MLDIQERFEVLKFIRICCNFGLLPLQVDLTSWQLQAPSTARQCVCFVSYACLVLHVIYKSGSLAHACFFLPDVQLYQLIIHIIMVMGSIMAAVWFYVLYIRSPTIFASFVKMTLLGDVGGTDLHQSDQLKHWSSRLREYSLQDLIATNVPCMLAVAAAVIFATYVYDPTLTLLLYAALPSHLQNRATFGLCMLEEIRFLLTGLSIIGPVWQLQVISFDLACNRLRCSMRKIQNGMESRRNVYRLLRCLQLYMSASNNINSYLIYTWKLVSISVCIIGGYAAIAHFHEHPVFGCMYYAILVDCVLIYAVIYEKAFMIPELFERTIGCAILHMDGNRASIFGRQMRSIPPTGVKVGNFHMMERASTLIFMNFVVVNIVNMLVAYG